MTTFPTAYLSRLQTLHSSATDAPDTGSPEALRHRIALARRAGQDAAANVLTWAQVLTFRDLLPAARDPIRWCGAWGAERANLVAGATIAQASAIATDAEWLAFLEGVEEVAQAVEAAA